MKTPVNINHAVMEERKKNFAERADVRSLGHLLVAGLLHPWDYAVKIADLTEESNIHDPINVN